MSLQRVPNLLHPTPRRSCPCFCCWSCSCCWSSLVPSSAAARCPGPLQGPHRSPGIAAAAALAAGQTLSACDRGTRRRSAVCHQHGAEGPRRGSMATTGQKLHRLQFFQVLPEFFNCHVQFFERGFSEKSAWQYGNLIFFPIQNPGLHATGASLFTII